MNEIEHVVVVMMENRSFDNLLGWLYDNTINPPLYNLPDLGPPSFDGLEAGTYYNQLNGTRVYATHPPTAWPPANNPNVVPTPDPNEEFSFVTRQLYGTLTPPPGATADMSGFLLDYSSTGAGVASAGQIMQSFAPQDATVLNSLARNFSVCDGWFASVPSQTWPNRSFVHTGSSDGHLNNDDYEIYDIPTIFNILESQGKSWGIFHDTTLIPSLTLTQFFPRLAIHDDKLHKFNIFTQLCAAANSAVPSQKLPQYSFIEPRFTPELGLFAIDYPEDYHPPHNICRGEHFLAAVYQAVRTSPYRDKILLLITFDEHGGCFDHLPPPTGAAAPSPWPQSRDGRFDFSRFGVRVPTVVVSSYIRPGTVFRSPPGGAPFDHTSILATLRDWLQLDQDPKNPFLPSPRIRAAPTIRDLLTLDDMSKNTAWPEITPTCTIDESDKSLQTPLNDLQRSLLAAAVRQSSPTPSDPATIATSKSMVNGLQTYEHALNFMHPDAPKSSDPA